MVQDPKGMTVIELIAVVGVIAILASFLVAGIFKGREAVRSGVCYSNLKQLGVAIHLYVQDDRLERLPGYSGAWDNFKNLMPLLYPYLSSNTTISALHKKLEVFRCPSNLNREAMANRADAFGNRIDYEYNNNIQGVVVSTKIAVPEWATLLYDWPVAPVLPIKNIHRGGCNILFYDGHVKWYSRTEMLRSRVNKANYQYWGLF